MAKAEFCRLETDFVLNDPRVMAMPSSDFRLYIFLWAYAVHARSERLVFTTWESFVIHRVHHRAPVVIRSAARLVHQRLIEWNIDDKNTLHVTVYGVKSKHAKLHGWKDAEPIPYGDRKVSCPDKLGAGESESESEVEKEVEVDNTTRPPEADGGDAGKAPKATKPPKTGKHRDLHCDAFEAAYLDQFKMAYERQTADFVQLARWRKAHPDVTPEQFADIALWCWGQGDYCPQASLTLKGLCAAWAKLVAKSSLEGQQTPKATSFQPFPARAQNKDKYKGIDTRNNRR